jgi:hypothetical protein
VRRLDVDGTKVEGNVAPLSLLRVGRDTRSGLVA